MSEATTISVDEVEEAMRDVVDPELGINVVDLGLVYGVQVGEDRFVTLDMTLTSAACPLTDVIEDQTREALTGGPGGGLASDFRINWVWMPPWGPDKITDDGREQLRALVSLEVCRGAHRTAVVFGGRIHQRTLREQMHERPARIVRHRGVQGARTALIHDVHRHAVCEQCIDQLESARWSFTHRNRDRTIELYHRRRLSAEQHIVQPRDLAPVGLVRTGGFGVHGTDRGLQRVRTKASRPQCSFSEPDSLADLVAIPQ